MRPTFAAALAGLALVGCGDSLPPRGGTDTPATTPSASAPARVEVLTVGYAGLDAAVKQQKGKVVLVDVWSLG